MSQDDVSSGMAGQVRMPVTRQSKKQSWDRLQPIIYQLYIVRRLTLKNVIQMMEKEHGFVATPKMYADKLKHWGYAKNARLQDIIELRQQRLEDPAQSREEVRRFVDSRSVEKYSRRNDLALRSRGLAGVGVRHRNADDGNEETIDGVLSVSRTLSNIKSVEELFLQCTKNYIRQSFIVGKWNFRCNDDLIDSSDAQPLARANIHSFLSGLELGCREAREERSETATIFWQSALKTLDDLVQSSYHDVIPNLIRGIVMLRQQGYHQNAAFLQATITQKAHELHSSGTPEQHKIFHLFKDMDPSQLLDVEERVLEIFNELFEWHLGPTCYSAFVQMMNHARLRLLNNPQLQLERYLPDGAKLDQQFGPTDRRSMDAVREIAEFHFRRKDYIRARGASSDLVARANLRAGNDEWLHHYFLLKGLYLCGGSEFHIGLDSDAAAMTLQKFITVLNKFDQMEPACIFRPERSAAYDWLQQLSLRTNQIAAATEWQDKQTDELLTVDAMNRFLN